MRRHERDYSPAYLRWLSKQRDRKPSPAARLAVRLYASGAVKTQKEAAEMVGITPASLNALLRNNEESQRLAGEVETAVADRTIELSKVIQLVSRKAVGKVAQLIDSQNEHVALKASADVLDRNPETSKTQKVAVASFNMDARDAKEIAAALVESARAGQRFAGIENGDYVKITEDEPIKEISAPSAS